MEHVPSKKIFQDTIEHVPGVKSKDRIASYIDALATSRESLVKNNIFIFISSSKSALDGRIVSIDPNSSLVIDVLKQYGSGSVTDIIKSGSIQMYRNGVRIFLDEELVNGDVLTLPPQIIDLIDF